MVRCLICKDGIETEFHLFNQCNVAVDIWIDIFKRWIRNDSSTEGSDHNWTLMNFSEYNLHIPIPNDRDDETVEQIRKRSKWENGDYDDDVAWWVESGASIHVYKYRCWFKTYESLDDESILDMGNKSTAMVHRHSCADLRFSFGKVVSLINIIDDIANLAFISTFKLNDSTLWHVRLGHVHFKQIQVMSKNRLISDFDMDIERFCYVYLLHTKYETLDKFKVFENEVELQQRALIKRYKTDRRGEYMDTLYIQYVGLSDGFYVVRLLDPKLKTLCDRGIDCIFIGYTEHSKAFSLYAIEPNEFVSINSINESRGAIFCENRFLSIPRPSQRSMINGTYDIGDLEVSKEVLEEFVFQQPELRKSKRKRFSMKDKGEADIILGIKIKHESNGISVSHYHYKDEVTPGNGLGGIEYTVIRAMTALTLIVVNGIQDAKLNPKTLDEAFSLAGAAETRFANLDIWEFLRSNPSTLGEDFFKARINEARFEIVARKDKEHIIEKKIDVILPLQGKFASPKAKRSLNADEYISVEEVVGGGEALGIGEDDDLGDAATDGGDGTVESGDISILNSLIGHGSPRSLQLCGTISTMKVLIDKEVDKEVQYDVYTLHVLIPFLKRLNDQYIKKKKMKAAMQRRLWDPGIKKNIRHHLEGKVVVKEWGMIRPWLGYYYSLLWDDPERWIFAITKYFSLLNTPADQRLRIVGFNLEGVGAEWFRWMSWNGLITTWDRFRELLASKPMTLGYVFSLARIIKARFEAIAKKEHNIKEKVDTTLSLPSEEASLVVKGPLDASEDTLLSLRRSVDEVSSVIEDVFDIDESNVEGMQVRDKFAEFFEDRESVEKVLSATKLPKGGNSHSGYSPYHLEDKVNFEGVGNVTPWAAEVRRRKRVKCYIQGSGRRKRKKVIGRGSGRQFVMG
ncbi:zinc finger, CCHC-type containing protein [Tanacetum coccineum]|uniref:Zinc finger, CCHC-type containing protein n=1 Tax=Tanacetum coccineum TaxID=301880 RepID=A0ABQ5JA44_9ASTR